MTWVDLEAPSRDELKAIMDEFSIASEIEEEIVKPTPYPLFASMTGYVYLILHFPTADLKGGARNQEVDFIVGRDFIITVRYELIGSIHHLHKAFEAEALLGTPAKAHAGPFVVERVMRRLYSSMREEVEGVAEKLDRIERDIFSGKERATVRIISEVGRVLLRFDTSLVRHAEPLGLFLNALSSPGFFGRAFDSVAKRIESEREHAEALVASFRAVAKELRETNDSLLSTNQSEVMKIFTGITVAVLPLNFIAAALTIPAAHTPIIGTHLDFWVIVGVMVVVEIFVLAFLRHKKWI
jgi:Mg2+ and Co2+ transporter CorA